MLIREKEKPYLLIVINKIAIKQNKRIVRHEIIPIRAIIGKHTKKSA
jgi:hypothetical protein